MSATIKITRRDFLRHTGVGAGALVFSCSVFPTESLSAGTITDLLHKGFPLNPFVAIKLDGTIIIMAHRSEMG